MPELTPLEWLAVLDKKLTDRQPELARYEAYYEGRHRLAFATSKFRETFGSLFGAFADNWCDLVIDASVERLRIDGFRFGDSEDGDEEAWRIFQANGLDAESAIGFTEAVKCGESYLLVGPNEDDANTPLITTEHPAQVYVASKPGFRRRRSAALKKWLDDSGYVMATVYLPDMIFKYQSANPVKKTSSRIRWVPREGDDAEIDNELGVVPMIPVCNNPSMLGGGRSDIAKVIPMQDAVNKLVADMIVASEYAAFRQRWASGIEIPIDPDTGQSMNTEKFLSSVSRMWTVGNEDAKFGEFQASDLSNYVQAIEMLVQHVAAQTRTPPHYLLGSSGAFPSGESLKATETGLVAKVERKHLWFGESFEEAMRLAFKLTGDTERAGVESAETIWKDPESRTEGEHTDAVLKMQAMGVPQEALWEMLPTTPPQRLRWKKLQAKERLDAAMWTPPPPVVAPIAPTAPAPV